MLGINHKLGFRKCTIEHKKKFERRFRFPMQQLCGVAGIFQKAEIILCSYFFQR